MRRSVLTAGLVAAAGVAATTAVIFALREVVPVVSTGVLYLLIVLLVSSRWGLWAGLGTSLLSALAFNFFHIPPTGRFTIAQGEDWVALVVFFAAAVMTSTLADAVRSREAEAVARSREADLSAELARLLLSGRDPLPIVSERIASSFDLPWVELQDGWGDSDERRLALPLVTESGRVGTLLVPRGTPESELDRLRSRLLPSLTALMSTSQRRAQLEEEVVETRALRRSDDLKTAILRAVSHDLRSPLTAIRTAAAGVGSRTVSEAEREELAAVIAQETERLSHLVDDLLDLSRLEAGTVEPRRESYPVDELVDAAARSAPGAQLDLDLDSGLPLVMVDAAQVERALGNVLENAARHANGQPVAVRARANPSRVIIRVSDRGPGIPHDELERVFEPFHRGSDEGGGSGLGLAIARGFVEANGGRMRAESLPGQGATFVIDLPAA